MLQCTTILTLLILSLATGGVLYTILNPFQETSHQREWKTPKQATCYPTKQMRSGVQKDLWMSDEKTRLHHRMISPRSILTAYPKGDNFELIEEMQGMKCYLQENIEDRQKVMQQIRFIESESGTFHYSDLHFDAYQVFLAFFRLPGNALQTQLDFDSAFLKGVAKDVSLSFAENSPDFHAEKFKAHIRPKQHE